MHVIPAEILNGHDKILIDNIASELIVIENDADQNDIDDNVQNIGARLLLAIRKKEILSQLKVKLILLFPVVL
jgi:hypothetical protein